MLKRSSLHGEAQNPLLPVSCPLLSPSTVLTDVTFSAGEISEASLPVTRSVTKSPIGMSRRPSCNASGSSLKNFLVQSRVPCNMSGIKV
jgi:hypothetical protein